MTHEDEARLLWARLQTTYMIGNVWASRPPIPEIAAALAAAERAGIERAIEAEVAAHVRCCHPCGCCSEPGDAARALLPAEPAAKCEKCGGRGVVCDGKRGDRVQECTMPIGQCPNKNRPCPACAAGGAT